MVGGVWREDVKTISKNAFEFREARLIWGNKGTGVVVMGGVDGKRMEGTGKLSGYEQSGITSGEEELDEVDGVGMEIIRVPADLPPLDDKREGRGWNI